jgi:hypothetical protein
MATDRSSLYESAASALHVFRKNGWLEQKPGRLDLAASRLSRGS